MATEKKKNKSKGLFYSECQLIFAFALFVGSLFLFLVVDLVSFSWFKANLEARTLANRPKQKSFLRADLTSKYYPIRDYGSRDLPELSAESFLAFDLKNGEFLAKNKPNKEVSIASITKLLAALVVQENKDYYLQKGNLRVPKLKDFPVEPQLRREARYSFENLFQAMLAASNNEASYTFAHEFPEGKKGFLKAMERRGEKLGMKKVDISNPAGFDKNGGNYATAKSLLLLINGIFEQYPSIFDVTLKKRVVVKSKEGKEPTYLYNTNYFVRNESFKRIIGQKTGHTSVARDCMVLIEGGDFGKIVYIVLGSKDRVADMRTLIDWTHEAYEFGQRD